MRLAIITDIHSNLIALKRVLAHIEEMGAERVCCLGDIVGYGPFPNECVELIRSKCSVVVAGNHDAALAGKVSLRRFDRAGQKALKWTQKTISEDNLAFLRGLPLVTMDQDLTFAHSSPARPDEWKYILAPAEAREAFGAFSTPICYVGHTHIPIVIGEDLSINAFRKGGRFLINVGSVGQPRDGDPRAAFGLFDTEKWSYDLVRLEYDVQQAAEAVRKAGLPKVLATRLISGY